tara:strand:- start:7651 stop:9129 length:1479 start_codon:yes stop_codon:yes gene_type:complete
MSELVTHTSPERLPTVELPREMGFQSYEKLNGEKEYREGEKARFFAGETRNPKLDYPLLDEEELRASIRHLEPVLDQARQFDDELIGDVVWSSAGYRMAEMYWLLEAKRMNELASNPESEAFQRSADRYQKYNEELYGCPDPEKVEAVYGEIIALAQEKKLHPTTQTFYDELVYGKTMYLQDTMVRLQGIGNDHPHRLPQDVNETLDTLREVLLEKFPDITRIVTEYWEQEIQGRQEDQRLFNTNDMQAVFERVRDFYDPDNEAGIGVVINPSSAQLSWDTPSNAIKIGGQRQPINDISEMIPKVVHEYGHGLRALNGKKSGIPTLGTGMYTAAGEGERPDYLTFEEGFLTLCQMAIGDKFTGWGAEYFAHMVTLGGLYEGQDFREMYERCWRMHVVVEVPDGEEPSAQLLREAKEKAYVRCVRAKRGTPTELKDGPLLSFNKDLAYLNGILDALDYLKRVGTDKEQIARLWDGKFDPTNSIQDAVAQRTRK